MAGVLMKSVSGIRGVVGDALTPDLVVKICAAFARYCGRGTIVVGRDSRITGGAIAEMVESALVLSGSDVVRLGIVPTPTVQLAVEELKADGGIIITASHNPIEWNAFKLVHRSGSFLNSTQIQEFFAMMDEEPTYVRWDKLGASRNYDGASDMHIRRVLSTVRAAKIKKMKYKVALDSVNGAGSLITQDLLKRLGCKTIPVHCTITGTFPRGAEPLPKNLKGLAAAVRRGKADIGFAQDPDADRLAIVDEKGRPIGEENTLALVVEHLLSKKSGRVVINLSTTKTVEDIAAKYKSRVTRTKVGEINVVEEMQRGGARIGGEGNGGIISPEVHLGRDSLVGIGYILEMMAERDKTVSELVAELPRYVMKKGKVELPADRMDPGMLARIKERYKEETLNDIDGLRIDFTGEGPFQGGWVHLRSSNTEPIFRIITEGKSAGQAAEIYSHFEAMIQ
jgi:phosphomannomutase